MSLYKHCSQRWKINFAEKKIIENVFTDGIDTNSMTKHNIVIKSRIHSHLD